jgi:hypothetical protein
MVSWLVRIIIAAIPAGELKMTKKHFVELAKAINAIADLHARLQAASAVAGVASKLNPRFDADRFFAACGVSK